MNIQILILLLIFIQINGQTLQSICMDDFLAVDMDRLENSSTTHWDKNELVDCFEYIADFKSKIRGFNTYAECYINEEYLTVLLANNIRASRCGQWLQLVGPSQKSVVCMVAGTHNISLSEFENVSIIAMRSELFDGISHKMTEQTELYAPITVAETDFDLESRPKLFVAYTSLGYNLLHFVDTNKLPAKITILGVEYFMDQFGRYQISYKGGFLLSLSLISYANERIDFHNVDLSDRSFELEEKKQEIIVEEFQTQARFPNYIMSKCHYLAENHVYEEGVVRTNKFFHWHIIKVNVDKDGNHIDNETIFDNFLENKFVLDITHEYYNIEMSMEPSATIISLSFKWLEIILETNFDVDKFEFLEAVFFVQNKTKDIRELIQMEDQFSLPVKYLLNQSLHTISIKVAFPITYKLFVDKIILRQRVKDVTGNENYKITVKNITFIRRDEYSKQPSCSAEAMFCKGTECTIPMENYIEGVTPWESKYCMPECGICQVGFFCNASGICEKDINKNTRSNSNIVWILYCILFLLVVIF